MRLTAIPYSVRVGAVTYTVQSDAAAIKAYSDATYSEGACEAYSDHNALVIYLNPAHHSSAQRVSLLHEVMHCCLRQSGCWPDAYSRTIGRAKGKHGGYDVEELTVAGMAAMLLGVMIENPQLVDYLRFGPGWNVS